MAVNVYVDLGSQPCRALVLFLRNTEIPFQIHRISLRQGDQRKPGYAEITPLATVPAIQDGDFGMGETVAIIRYLTAKFADKVPDHWYPKDLEKRARVDEYLAWHPAGTRAGCAGVYVSEVMIPWRTGKPVVEERVNESLDYMKTQLDKLERAFVKNNKYLAGDDISVADIFAVCEMMQNTVNGRDVTEGRPQLKDYVQRVKDRLNPAFDEIHEDITLLYKKD